MDVEEARQTIEKRLTEKRYRHSLGVSETAGVLADRFGANRDQAKLAGMLHDACKCLPDEQLAAVLSKHPDAACDFLCYSPKLWHAPAGALFASETCAVADQAVLNAILYHTTGRAGMDRLEKIIFVADYIEPGRDFSGVETVREAALTNLDQAVFLELKQTIAHLLSQNERVYPKTFEAYNDLAITIQR
ncbi:MAG: bis(5'-nucleosyl)-tetraphosphatase (symmetrical) YqeK [Sporolactobacillus sp.]